jgi:FkbM family methyltransferase
MLNILRFVYPLSLRQRIFSRLVAKHFGFPRLPESGALLSFAPVRLPALLPTDWGHRQIAWLGFYELDLTRRLVALARSGGVLVDVGANAGYFSCLWAASNCANRVYAFEPSPRNMNMIAGNLQRQRFRQQIQVFGIALSREPGIANFDLGPSEQTGWGGLALRPSDQTLRVEVKRLDEVLPAGLHVDVLKIDTEGADAWVMEGAERIIREKRVRHIFFEENRERMSKLGIPPDAARTMLTEFGYTVRALNRDASECHASIA